MGEEKTDSVEDKAVKFAPLVDLGVGPLELEKKSIVIVLDTNIFQQNKFHTKLIQEVGGLAGLFRRFKAVMPEPVLIECKRNYLEEMKAKLPHVGSDFATEFQELERQVGAFYNKCLDVWVRNVHEKFEVKIPTSSIYRKGCRRLLDRISPCAINKDETRDALIWETLLSYAAPGRYLIFVTNNSKDFNFNGSEVLKKEIITSNILAFGSFWALRKWLEPLSNKRVNDLARAQRIELSRVDHFRRWYKPEDFEENVSEQLDEALPNHLIERCEYYAYYHNVEMVGCLSSKVNKRSGSGSDAIYDIEEEWDFEVTYDVSGLVRFGGSDGIEDEVTDTLVADGTVLVSHVIEIEGNDLKSSKTTVKGVNFDKTENWNPYDHY